MRLWTVQHKDVLDTLNSDKIYIANSKFSKIYGEKGKQAYDLIISEIGSFPIWCLHSYEGMHLTTDNIENNYNISGILPLSEERILIEIDKPAKEVLLTDFYKWVDTLYYFQDATGVEADELRKKGCSYLEYAKRLRKSCTIQGIIKNVKRSDVVNAYDISRCHADKTIKLLKMSL